MKISNKLPQFDNEKALIVAAGSQDSHVYLAGSGKIEQIVYFEISLPDYSDKGGMFGREKHGQVMAEGSVKDYTKFKMNRDFLKELAGTIGVVCVRNDIDSVYLFAPRPVLAALKRKMPHPEIKMFIEGVFCQKHPFELLEKIKEKQGEQAGKTAVPVKEEVRKLLKKKMQ